MKRLFAAALAAFLLDPAAIRPGGRYLIVDDVIATGGTAAAVASLVAKCGASVAACVFLLELTFLNGRDKLAGAEVVSLVSY